MGSSDVPPGVMITVRQAAKALGFQRKHLERIVQAAGGQVLTSGAMRYVRLDELRTIFPEMFKT